MPRQRVRRRLERKFADELGDIYKFTNDPELAAQRAQARKQRRQEASARDTTKWVRCMIRGCTQNLTLQHGDLVAVCHEHAIDIWESVERLDESSFLREVMAAEIAKRDALRAERRDAVKAKSAEQNRSPEAWGEIYFVRTGGLIKVGWSSDLESRLRSYGPEARVLVHYAAQRKDETNLHRQLKPARAKGREWYHDGDVIALFVERAIAEHGEPEVKALKWTTHDGAKVKVRSWH